MTNALVGRFDTTAPDGIASLAGRAVVQPPLTVPQKANQLPDFLGCLGISWLQGLQPLDRPVHVAPEQAGHHGFHPLLLLPRVLPKLQARHLVHMLTAVVVVQDLHGGRKEGADLVPDPLRPVSKHAHAHLCLRPATGPLACSGRVGTNAPSIANTKTGRHVLPAAISATRWAISAAVGLTSSTPTSWLSSPVTSWSV